MWSAVVQFDSARMRCADARSARALDRCNLRTLRDPSREDHASNGLGFFLAEDRPLRLELCVRLEMSRDLLRRCCCYRVERKAARSSRSCEANPQQPQTANRG